VLGAAIVLVLMRERRGEREPLPAEPRSNPI
jgi:hypothetical protein